MWFIDKIAKINSINLNELLFLKFQCWKQSIHNLEYYIDTMCKYKLIQGLKYVPNDVEKVSYT